MKSERSLFTLLVSIALVVAVQTSWGWPTRASIIVLILGGIGIILSLVQLTSDLRRNHAEASDADGPSMDSPALEHEGRWGSLEIWSWIVGFYGAIHIIGFLAAVFVFILAYAKVYGARWRLALILSGTSWLLIYAVFDQILHVHWPKSLLLSLF